MKRTGLKGEQVLLLEKVDVHVMGVCTCLVTT